MKREISAEAGFTLLELVVVTAIIGILASLAIANYAVFKANAYNTTAAADCRNLAPAADFASSNSGSTPPLISLTGAGGPVPLLPGGSTSPGTLGTITIDRTNQTYGIQTYHSRGDVCFTLTNGTSMMVTPGICS